MSVFRRTGTPHYLNVNATPLNTSADPATLHNDRRSPSTSVPSTTAMMGVNTAKKLTLVECHVFSSEK